MTRERLWPPALFLILVLPLSWYQFLIRGSSAADSGINPLGPVVAALIVCAVSGQFRDFLKRIFRVRAAPSTYAIALLLPAFLCLTGVAVGALATGTPFPVAQAASRSIEFVDAFLVALLFVALGEEPGWRGYLLPALTGRIGPVMATLAICPIWAIWHYPLMGTQLPLDLLPQFLVSLIGGAFILSWLTLRTRGGVLPAMLCHAMINGIGANYLYRLFEGKALTIIWWTNSLLWLAAGAYAAFAMQRDHRLASSQEPVPEAKISPATS